MAQIKPLPEALQKIAIDEMGEVPARIPEDLLALKTWIQQQPHLKARTDDQFLIQFLRGCKYSLEKSKKKIDMFHAMKTKCPELFSITDVDDVEFRNLHNENFYARLPTPLNGCGPRIVMIRFSAAAQEVFHMNKGFQYIAAAAEVMMMVDEYASINGLVVVVDLSEAKAFKFLEITLKSALEIAAFYEKAMPLRLKSICCINVPKHVMQFLNMILPLQPEKFRNRFIIIGDNLDDLDEYIPRKYLPCDYGGENGSMDQLCVDFNKVWDDNREYFKQNAECGTDERLRIGEPIAFDGEFGICGTFRKLDVD